ncbi:MAG: hypothetical protein ACSHX9_16745 [Luteolibacter sp.]
MNLPLVAFVVYSTQLFAEPEAVTVSSDRLTELGRKSEPFTKETSEKDVALILGEPQSKGIGGWIHPECKVWHYLDYTNDSLHRSFSVWFDPEARCYVSKVEILRSEIEKLPLLVSKGKVLGVYPDYPKKGGKGFLCHVRFDLEDRDFKISVAVANLDRVKGSPIIGANVEVQHRRMDMNYIFIGSQSLYLESMIFTDDGEMLRPPDGDNEPK